MNFIQLAETIGEPLKSALPKQWDGRESILEMREAGYPHWKQMEWIGFYYEFLCENILKGIMEFPGPKYGKPEFDGFYEVPWDLKAHSMNTSSHKVIVNDSEATAKAIEEYGFVGLSIAIGEAIYNDEDRTFQLWHSKLKGGLSQYEKERVKRGAWSRIRKVAFNLLQISFIKITDNTLIKCGSFQTDFRNSNGQPRRAKVLIDLEKLDEETAHFIEFD